MSSADGQRERASADSRVPVPASVRAHTWPRLEACWSVLAASRVPVAFLAGKYSSQTELWTPLIWLAGWHVRGYFVLIPAMNAERRPSLGRTNRNHASPSVASIFICASCTRSFCSSLFPSLLEIITRHVRRPVGGEGGLSHCLLSFWLSKWHRISSCSCLPLWHYNYP